MAWVRLARARGRERGAALGTGLDGMEKPELCSSFCKNFMMWEAEGCPWSRGSAVRGLACATLRAAWSQP
jgi:hypothetical protein